MSEYIGDDLPSKVSDLVNISIEAVIAEIIDNSLDKEANIIEVNISGTNWDNFSITTYDNSPIGFASEEELDIAFRMGGKKFVLKKTSAHSTWVQNHLLCQNLETLQYLLK